MTQVGENDPVVLQLKGTSKGQLKYDNDWSPTKQSKQFDTVLRISPILLTRQKTQQVRCIVDSRSSSESSTKDSVAYYFQGEMDPSGDKVRGPISNMVKNSSDIEDISLNEFVCAQRTGFSGEIHDSPCFKRMQNTVLGSLRNQIGEDMESISYDIEMTAEETILEKKKNFLSVIAALKEERNANFAIIKEDRNLVISTERLLMQNLVLQYQQRQQEEFDNIKQVHEADISKSHRRLKAIRTVKQRLEEEKQKIEAEEKKIEEDRKIKEEESRKQQEKQKTLLACAKKLEALAENGKTILLRINENLRKCKNEKFLPASSQQISEQATAEFQKCVKLVSEGVTLESIMPGRVNDVLRSVSVLQDLEEQANLALQIAEQKAHEEESKQKLQNQLPASSLTKTTGSVSTYPAMSASENKPKAGSRAIALDEELSLLDNREISAICIPSSVTEIFRKLRRSLESSRQKYSGLTSTTDKQKKQYRFNLKGAINTPLNAVSDQSPRHLMDKIVRISSVLAGKTVEMSGKRVNPLADPQGLDYCKGIFAEEIVMQGAKQVASSHNSAFAFALVALGIWVQFPDVGELIQANFYEKCPYLAPFYPFKIDGESSTSYYKRLGYDVEEDVVETKDKYLKKLSGIVRLYAALIQSPMPPQFSRFAHPLGLSHAWSWFSQILNLEPRPTITATMIFDFLEVAGHAMLKLYGIQFRKLLRAFFEDYIAKIDAVTPNGEKGPVIRLKSFLDKCIKKGQIEEPAGYLPASWWHRS